MTTKSTFVECNRSTATSNIYSNDYHRWRTTLKDGFSIKKGDQLRMNMAVLSLLGTGDYIEMTDDDLQGDPTIINPYASVAQQREKDGTGIDVSFYYNNNSRGKGKWFEYGTNAPQNIGGTNPTTTFDNKNYYAYRQATTYHLINNLDQLHNSSSNNLLSIDNNDVWTLQPDTTNNSSKFLEKVSGFVRNKCSMKMLNTPNQYPSGGDYMFGFTELNGNFRYKFVFFKNGSYNIVCDNVVEGSGTWEKGDRFKISRRMYGVYWKQMKHDHIYNTDEYCGEDGENHLDYYTNVFHKDIRSQQKIDNELYDNEWDEPDLHICIKNNTTDSPFIFGDVKHNKLREYLRTDNNIHNCKWSNPKILHKRDDDGYFTHYKTGERITDIDKDHPHPSQFYYKENLGAIDTTAFHTPFLFDLDTNSAKGFTWLDSGFYSESDIATRITEQLNNCKGYYPYSNNEGTNPTGSKGLITNGLLWYYEEAVANDDAEYIFVSKYWYKPLPPLNEMYCLFFPAKRSLVGATSPVVIYNDSISRFEIQYLHAPYKIQQGNDKGQDTLIMCCNTGAWDGSSYPKNVSRDFLDKFGGIGLNNFINNTFWRKLGFNVDSNVFTGYNFISTEADINISYNASVEQYSLPDQTKAQPDEEADNTKEVKFVDAKSSAIRATFLPLKVEFPYFLMLTNLPISGVGNKFYANDGGIYNCLGHIARNYSALDFIYQLDGNTFTVDADATINYIDIDIRLPNMGTPPNITSYSSVILEFISTIQDPSFTDLITISTIDTSPTPIKGKNRKSIKNREPEDDREDKRIDNRDDNRDVYK